MTMGSFKPDQTDLKLMKLLQVDGRMPFKELADAVGKSINAVTERIKKLKKAGFIGPTVVLLDLQMLDRTFIAFPHINLTNHLGHTLTMFKEQMIRYPEVMECYHLTGHYDFMLKVVLPTMADYDQFLKLKISSLPYVGAVQSFLALSEVKRTTAYPFL